MKIVMPFLRVRTPQTPIEKRMRAEDQEPVRRNHEFASAPSFARCAAERPLRSSAPTIAASRRIETISNGKMYDSNSAMPIDRASLTNGPGGRILKTAYFER